MAGTRIRGVTIELSGDASKLNKEINSVDKSLKNTQKELKDVDRLLKLDPKNTQLLAQKQELLGKAVDDTKKKLADEQAALEALKASPDADKTIEQQRALERDIAATTAQLKTYEGELGKTKVSLADVGTAAQNVADKTKALSAAAAAFGAALIANAYKSAQAADDLNTLAKTTGFSTEELQKMQYAADRIDVSFDTMTGSIKKLTSKMASGDEIFDRLGISIYDANGNMRDATDVWYEAIDALSQVENETERDALSMEIFGKSAMDMAGIVDDGGAALREFGAEAEEAGLIIEQDALDAANDFNDAIDKLKATAAQSFLKAGATLTKVLLPALEKVGAAVTKVASWFANLTTTQQKTILTIIALVAAISPVAAIIAKIISVVNTLKTAMTGLSSVFTFFTSPVGLVVAAIAALIAIGVLLYKNWDTIKAKAQQLWSSITTTFNNIKASIGGTIENIRTSVSNVFNGIKSTVVNIVDGIKSTVTSTFDRIKYAITHPIETARDTISNIIQRIKDLFNFNWELPHIKLPHFSVKGGQWPYGLGGSGYLPSISIDWYAKAMRNGMILNSPTIFGMQNGSLLGGGEAGSEVVVGTNSLMNMIRQASGGVTVNMTVNARDQDVYQLADLVSQKLVAQIKRERAVYS